MILSINLLYKGLDDDDDDVTGAYQDNGAPQVKNPYLIDEFFLNYSL